LFTWDKEKLEKYARNQIKMFVAKICDLYDSDSEKLFIPDVTEILDTADFWDFRTCEEYPDCLYCFEEEGCHGYEKDFYSELKEKGPIQYQKKMESNVI
jgi:hypothetical protein